MGRASEDPAIIDRAAAHARRWLESVPGRRVPADGTADDAAARLGTELPDEGRPAAVARAARVPARRPTAVGE
jgi:hypothetical protein